MVHYAPANCDCNPTASTSTVAILNHVQHCADDYRGAVKRIKLGITKFHAAAVVKTQDVDTLSVDQHT